ncbi:YihA family ribosome biogenesis GTP-binding protein [Psychrosphaera ytuae]|uniref:Probable GTP-binding protein EngB n=1 Tax=Psychrosphaera ytuae TaxID=2820710 RepID=A0A975DDW5_9GAMM|nr:ribosome biogenesis GTP-binding protein YihA/YsxC [Psychrosphaera ytuae]QTH65375.1 YihA family ribosome biogenesis GTP-binding protein [Psychrosphaera ytuae]
MINYRKASFFTSAPDIRKLPPDTGYEVAFAGRSNAGKSSSLNTLTQQTGLARTSKTPGRTQLINVFNLEEENRRLIDLPGYGFAKVPLAMKLKWQKSLSEYLEKRECLRGLVVLMDIRHPMKDLDQDLIYWAVEVGLPVLVLLTKADKFKSGKQKAELLKIREASLAFQGDVTVELFSSLKKQGIPQLSRKLDEWLNAAELVEPKEQAIEEIESDEVSSEEPSSRG